MGILDRPKAGLHRLRVASPGFDHVVRAYGRYNSSGGGRLSSSVTLPGFLSFFPLLAVAFLVLAIVLSGRSSAQSSVLDGVKDYLPGLLCSTAKGVRNYPCGTGKIDVNGITPKSTAGVLSGVIGFVGLALAGTGWVNNLRTAIRTIWRQDQSAGNFLTKKLKDIAILVVLGLTLIASVGVSGLATSATRNVLDFFGIGDNGIASLGIKVLGVAISIGVNQVLFLIVFTQLGDKDRPIRKVARGCLLAGCLFEVLQIFGATYIARTTGNPVYGIFAVIIGLIVYIGLVVQITLFAAAWTVTAPYLDDTAPSGLDGPDPLPYPEGPGLPPGGLDADTGSGLGLGAGRGSVSGLGAVLGSPLGRGRPDRPRHRPPEADLVPEPAGSTSARVAGVAGVGLLAASVAGVAVYGIRTLRDATR